ncbi:hypothetical protein M3Y99_01875300 [Aphelenchoides fujianensis]|nr:hypothetical protein M3Y99_01875300 [Aphelenchoides fujianensis]
MAVFPLLLLLLLPVGQAALFCDGQKEEVARDPFEANRREFPVVNARFFHSHDLRFQHLWLVEHKLNDGLALSQVIDHFEKAGCPTTIWGSAVTSLLLRSESDFTPDRRRPTSDALPTPGRQCTTCVSPTSLRRMCGWTGNEQDCLLITDLLDSSPDDTNRIVVEVCPSKTGMKWSFTALELGIFILIDATGRGVEDACNYQISPAIPIDRENADVWRTAGDRKQIGRVSSLLALRFAYASDSFERLIEGIRNEEEDNRPAISSVEDFEPKDDEEYEYTGEDDEDDQRWMQEQDDEEEDESEREEESYPEEEEEEVEWRVPKKWTRRVRDDRKRNAADVIADSRHPLRVEGHRR